MLFFTLRILIRHLNFKKDVFLGYFYHLYTMVKLFPFKIEDMDLPKTMTQCKELIDLYIDPNRKLDYWKLLKKIKGGTRKNIHRTKVNRYGRK